MYKYPYGDSQQLNLDWIISKIKELEEGGAGGGASLETVSNALISLTYNSSTLYRRYDYAFLNGKLYRCLADTSGTFDPAAWQEALIGDDLAVLTRWINAIDAAAVVDVKFDTSGTNGKLQQKYHDQYHDVVEVDYTPVQNSKRPLSSNAGYELNGAITTINNSLNQLSYLISTPSNVSCATATGTTIAQLSVTKGVWLITSTHEWTQSFSQAYSDAIYANVGGSLTQLAMDRGRTGADGGGATQSCLYESSGSATIMYYVAQYSGSDRVACRIRLCVVKVHD